MEPRLVRSAVHVGLLVGGGEERSTSAFKLVRTTHRFLAASFSWPAFFLYRPKPKKNPRPTTILSKRKWAVT